MVVRGRLRLYSASGFFLMLGLVILAIGIGMATLGYWPQSEAIATGKTQTELGSKIIATDGGAKASATGEEDGAQMAVTDGDAGISRTRHNVQGN